MSINVWGALICASIYATSGGDWVAIFMGILFSICAFIFSILGIMEMKQHES
jgi:hypothetical protein